MFNAIVTQPDEDRNVGFENLTSDERAEYDAWSDSVNVGTQDPLPEDFGFNPMDEDIDDDYIAAVKSREHQAEDYVPFDSELDALHLSELKRAGWTRQTDNPYPQAVSRLNQLHPFSRPDSLTRRGGVLIARRSYAIPSRKYAIDDLTEVIQRVFPEAVIINATLDRKGNARVRFSWGGQS